MPVKWDAGEAVKASNSVYYAEGPKALDVKGQITKDDPKALEIIAASKKVVTADYERPFETHARMEPINATVHVQKDRVDVWSPTQDQSSAVLLVADQLKVDPKIVYAHTMYLGGGYGGNGAGGTGVTRQAAEISKQVERPVKVLWSREEDIAQDKQRPMALARLSASVGDNGLPTAVFTRAAWFTQDKINQVGPRPPIIRSSKCRINFRNGITTGIIFSPISPARRIARRARTRWDSWANPLSMNWPSRAPGTRSTGASR